ncbi:MAG: hydrolase/aminopeptidase [Myxococcales bacterium 68-20]|nr:M1 family metallopeptidase [Myxococcales bacterium]OJY19263.1 MAG: hydrolase/aminopeptidase [Myxococcales bacterium 68-20]
MARLDPHSYADDTQPRTKSFDWQASVDFPGRVLHAEITLHFEEPAAGGPLDLDTRALSIDAVLDANGAPLEHTLHTADPILGSRLEISVPSGARSVHIRYRTSPEASALQWLTPEQTLGKQHPYLFSQCQAIHARSVIPCQDTPSIRQTFTASLDVPSQLRAVMAAAPRAREERGDRAVERFEMPQPIPPYLVALAVGDLASKELSPRSRVWAEPAQLEAAAWEFEQVEDHVRAAEALFGPYDWERFDLLVMPPSFPYGGMENPRLTFLTPSLLAGDRSLVNVLAHELAHSWTGNLVTNANAEHFWLNEGFTVFAERRILEALEGPEMAGLHAAVGHQKLQQAFAQHAERPELTKLRTHLAGIDPDDAFSVVPYEKGYFFLKALEAAAGREAFDTLLSRWLGAHRFGAVTTDDFLALVERESPGLLAKVDAKAWIDAPGLPRAFRKPDSARLGAVLELAGRVPAANETEGWSVAEWVLYLDAMPRPSPLTVCEELDKAYALTNAKNPEVLVSWLTLACESGYAAVLPRVEAVLGQTGRMKYLKPLYRALAGRAATKPLAQSLFAKLHGQYHPIAQQVVRSVLK